MVLLYSGQFSMHWVNVVGQSRASTNYIILNTDGLLYILGGPGELLHQMNAAHCWAQNVWAIERFNSVTCTEACNRKDAVTA